MSLMVDLQKHCKGFKLDVSFEAPSGCMGILGASGCGKSMTLKTIAGIVKPDQGCIQYGETVFYNSDKKINLKPQKRKTGFLFQNYALFPNMTVEENIGSGLFKKTAENQREVQKQIQRFHLTGLEKRYPSHLSGGQQQRAALARMLACKPQLLLFDEPFSALDAYLKEELQMELLDVLQDFEGTYVLVTHDRDEAYKLCENLLIMEEGTAVSFGSTKEMFSNPKNYQTARLTGCKNLSRAVKTGKNKVFAQDFGTEIFLSDAVSDQIKYIGIRAHDFSPAKVKEGNFLNYFDVKNVRYIDSPFEANIICDSNGENLLWCKIRKEEADGIPKYLAVAPENVMQLLS